MERDVHLENDEIVFRDPQFARKQTEKTFFAGARDLVGLRLEGNDVGAFSGDRLIRQPLPIVAIPQVVFVDGFDRCFGLVLFFGLFRRL